MKQNHNEVIKYLNLDFKKINNISDEEYLSLNQARQYLWNLSLIGVYQETGIGYGNVSIRKNYLKSFQTINPQFLISGTQTGHLAKLEKNHYSRVLDFNLNDNTVKVEGPIHASSEALTHGLIYHSNKDINSIFHIHNKSLWLKLIQNGQTTTSNCEFGTRELAKEAGEICSKSPNGYFAIKGHEDGIFVYGTDLESTLKTTSELINAFS